MSDYVLACEGILINVLLRIPADSLSRFRCVSTSWCDLIDSSYFRKMRHLFDSSNFAEMQYSKRTHLHPDPGSNMIITMVGTKFFTFDTLVKNGKKGYKAIAKKLRSRNIVGSLKESKYDSVYLSGSCNGIICVSGFDTGDFVVWNPYIDHDLHSDDLASPPYEFSYSYRYGSIRNAFGYDHVNDDYKLVKWRLNDAPRFDGKGYDLYELCVYSFKHDSWTTIPDAGELKLPSSDGRCHALGHYKTNLILTFDLGTYKFRKIACAPFPARADYIRTSLSGLNGCLWLGYTYTWPTKGFYRSAGPMRKYGVETSWTKLTSIIDQFPDYNYYLNLWRFQVVAYSEKRRKLLLKALGERHNPMIYDLNTKSLH